MTKKENPLRNTSLRGGFFCSFTASKLPSKIPRAPCLARVLLFFARLRLVNFLQKSPARRIFYSVNVAEQLYGSRGLAPCGLLRWSLNAVGRQSFGLNKAKLALRPTAIAVSPKGIFTLQKGFNPYMDRANMKKNG